MLLAGALLLGHTETLYAQCWEVQKGQELTVTTTVWANALPYTEKKWAKLKTSQRDDLVDKLNQRIESGVEAPFSTNTSMLRVTDAHTENHNSSITFTAIDAGYEYESTSHCTADTFYFVRNHDVLYSTKEGDTTGWAMQGVQRIPAKLEIGTRLPSYRDLSFSIPQTRRQKVLEVVKVFSYRTTTNGDMGWGFDPNGDWGYGRKQKTETHNVYRNIAHTVDVTEQVQGQIIYYLYAWVTAKESLEIGGQQREAFVIESQSWAKTDRIVNYETEAQHIAEQMRAKQIKAENWIAKRTVKRGYTNEAGYVITFRKEWFVPGIGIVRSETYDNHGAIQTRSEVSVK